MSLPDIVWLVHETDNEPLRYSIRSVVTHCAGLYGNLWVAGVMPDWLCGVGLIPSHRCSEKFADIRAKVTALATDDRLSDDVVIFNDDYYAVEQITDWSPYHMGPTSEYLENERKRGRTPQRNRWDRAIFETAGWMERQGYGDILCYEGHCPLMFNRARLAAVLDAFPGGTVCDYPGFYPAAGSGGVGVRALNAKIGHSAESFHAKTGAGIRWLSSNDEAFGNGLIGGFIRGMFRQPSIYEAVT